MYVQVSPPAPPLAHCWKLPLLTEIANDGDPGAVGTAYAVLRVFDPAVAAASFDLTKTYNDTFVKKAISGR